MTDSHDGIDLGVYCRASLAEHLDADEILLVTKQGFDWYHRAFDYRYPFDKYDQLFVPEFNAGAMENAACVTFLDDYVFRSKVTDYSYERRADTILHEMAHMWFGDLVTMRWWDDLWLNESFASFASGARAGAGDPVHLGLDDVRQHREDLGVPAGSAVLDAPDRRRHPRRAGGRGQLRRHHVREGRQRAQAAGRVRGDRAVPAGDAGLLPPVRVRQHHARRPARRAQRGVRPGPVPLVGAVAGDVRGQHAAAGVRARRDRAVHVVRDPAVTRRAGSRQREGSQRDRPARPA